MFAHDSNGRELKDGDRVWVAATVTTIKGISEFCYVSLPHDNHVIPVDSESVVKIVES